ncbi:salicylate synthase [Advenella kashmirensis]|uniref:salicylate synthase n=1 Tax=Advenella kashmirensis TaxID=310575 RepID=UPI00040BFCC5|nr:salicylate synthase [Advenella kashmirensis]
MTAETVLADDVVTTPDLSEIYRREGYLQPITLGQHLRRWARQYGPSVALTDATGHYTYADLDAWADRLATGFLGLDIQPRDVVIVQLPNCAAFAAVLFALLRIGAIPLLAMPSQRLHDLEKLAEQGRPVACVMPDRFLGFDYRPMAESLKQSCTQLRHIIIDGDAAGHLELDALEQQPIPPKNEPDPFGTALLLQSGGTTGTPKLIPRTHADYAYNAQASANLCGLTAESVYLAALPIAHNFPLCCPGLIGTLSVGGRIVMSRTPSTDDAFALIEREKVTVTALVPALIQLWLQSGAQDDTDISSLQLLQAGGARLPADIAEQVAPTLGCRLQQVFGMAEGLLCYTRLDDPDNVIFNTQGRPLSPHDDLRIVDADGNDVPAGEAGELITRGPYTIHTYYCGEKYNTGAFTPDGYYRSGDIVRRTPQGNILVEGRLKEQINRAGEKIATAEIEQLLRDHPDIQDTVVIAVPDAELGERSCAFIIPGADTPSLQQLHTFLRARNLARHKLPDQLETISAWPLTTVGKINKKRLLQLAGQSVARQRYLERTLPIDRTPLETAVSIARDLNDARYIVYEHRGQWSIGIGSLANIAVYADHITLDSQGYHQRWPMPGFATSLPQAIDALPFEDFRLYGLAHFELARLIHGLPVSDSQPLLQLTVPAVELRVEQERVVIRATEQSLLDEWATRLTRLPANEDIPQSTGPLLADIRNADADAYKQRVATAVKHIHAGDYEKIILSRAVPVTGPIDIAASYLAGRRANQPARSFLLQHDDLQCAGFSPETVVEVAADGWISTQPLAGTRKIGDSEDDTRRLSNELQNDTKEIAEHAVSVRLALEELQQVCANESVHVAQFMQVCRRGTVQHLGSRVRGRLDTGKTAWHAFQALFPAVTASGIPKHAAIDAIGRLEPVVRGLYSGCVLIADSDGALDAALVLRSLFRQQDRTWLHAGAGVVALSTPERELEETFEKLTSVAHFLVEAKRPA